MRAKLKKDYWIIKMSKLFDSVYYLKQYPDVRRADIDPIEHFVLYGWKEGRNPNEWFDTKYYIANNQDMAKAGINPFVHWIKFGRKEGRMPSNMVREYKIGKSYAFLSLLGDLSLANSINAIKYIKRYGIKAFIIKVRDKLNKNTIFGTNYLSWISYYDTISYEDLIKMKNHIDKLSYKPTFSIIMPTYNTSEKFLKEAIESVLNQVYPYWELCIADDNSNLPHVKKILEEYKKKDKRIKVVFRNKNGHISEASNSALELATGEYVCFLDHDDTISPHALYIMAVEINNHKEANVIYSDEDKIDENGIRRDPYFKPDWNYELFLSGNYICHFLAYKRGLVEEVGEFRKGFEGAQDYDLALRIIEKIPHDTMRHIPFVLYHWRIHAQSTASGVNAKSYARDAQYKALTEHFERLGTKAHLIDALGTYWRIKYEPNINPLVSIIIPTKDKKDLLEKCIFSILNKTSYKNFEIIIINNNSEQKETYDFFDFLAKTYKDKIKIIDYNIPFNWSALNNYTAQYAEGDFYLFLNNDVEVINEDWLDEMVSHMAKKDVGIVGAKLYYPNDTIQHAGVILGIHGVAGHIYRYSNKSESGYFGRLLLVQELSAVTGACMLVKKEAFEKVNGFDESFAVAFNDIDFCIRVREAGYKIIWTPYAELYHYEGISRSIDTIDNPRFRKEIKIMHQRWGHLLLKDPAYNPNLTLDKEQPELAFPPRVIKPWLNMI